MTTTEPVPDGVAPARDDRSRARDDGPQPVAVYEPVRRSMPHLGPYLRELRSHIPFMWHLARSELKAENYQTLLGQVWLVLNPLLLAGVFIVGRSILRPMGSPAERNALIAHLVMGIFYYQYVTDALGRGARSVLGNKATVLNTSLPRTVFPLSSTLRSLIDFLPLVVVLFGVQLVLRQPFTLSLLGVPLAIALFTMLNLGLTLGSSAIMVYYRDFQNVISLVTRLWMWSTPILYTTDEIPEGIRPVLELNPLYPFYALLEQVYGGEPISLVYVLWAGAWTVFFLVVGGFGFLMKEREFAVRL